MGRSQSEKNGTGPRNGSGAVPRKMTGLPCLVATATALPYLALNASLNDFDAAEAGFNAAWAALNDGFNSGVYMSFAGLYRSTFNGAEGLDDPTQPLAYFRNLTDEQIDIIPQGSGHFVSGARVPAS